MDDTENHQKAAHQHQDRRRVIGTGLSGRLFPSGLVIGQIGGVGYAGDALILQDLFGLFLQISGLPEGNAQCDIGSICIVVAGEESFCGLLCDPGAGLGEVGRAFPPAAEREVGGVLLSFGIGPQKAEVSARFMGNAKGIHGELIQCDFIRLFGKPSRGGHGKDGLRIVPVGDGKLHGTLADLRICKLPQAAEVDDAFYIRIFGNPLRLMLRQSDIENMAGGAVGVLIIQKKGPLHRAPQKKHEGIQRRHQGGGENQNEIFGFMKRKIPPHQFPADFQIVVCKHVNPRFCRWRRPLCFWNMPSF